MPASDERPKKVKVMDKRRHARAEAAPDEVASAPRGVERPAEEAAEQVAQAEEDLLDDLRRLQAEFDNYRKRVLREQTAMASRAAARLVERLLPVLDNLERAVSHGEGGPGVELVHKELRQVLGQEGLAEIEAEGAPFDPRIHEAFQVVDDPDAAEATVREVYRRGYTLRDQVLRPAMVVVARPPESSGSEDGAASATEPSGNTEPASGE
jgi:molecular chaperone GrpE